MKIFTRKNRVRLDPLTLDDIMYKHMMTTWGPMPYTAKRHKFWSGSYVCPDWEPECITCQSARLWQEVQENNQTITFDAFNAQVDAALAIAQEEGQAQRIKDNHYDSLKENDND